MRRRVGEMFWMRRRTTTAPWGRAGVVGLAVAAVALTVCREAEPSPSPEVKPSAAPAHRTVRFPSDGVRLEGTLYGEGDVGLVLSGGKGGQSQWGEEFPRALAGAGFVVLTYNWRGVCPEGPGDAIHGCSRGKPDATVSSAAFSGEACGVPPSRSTIPDDIRAAIGFLRSEGVDRLVLLGEGHIGGNGSIYVASEEPDIAGLISLFGGGECEFYGLETVSIDVFQRITTPVLFIDEAGYSGTGYAWTEAPKEQLVIPIGEGGVGVLFGDHKKEVTEAIIRFVTEHVT